MTSHGHSEVEKHDVDKHVRIYKKTFYTLIAMTVLTVTVAYQDFGIVIGVIVGLLIALFKGSLVASFFMHLVWEKKLILYIMGLAFIFFGCMMGLILWHQFDVPKYP